MTITSVIINLVIAAIILGLFVLMQKKGVSFSKRVLIALGVGVLAGLALQFSYGSAGKITTMTTDWLGLVGNSYIKFLQMIAIPLIFVSIVAAFTRLQLKANVAKIGTTIIVVLVVTAAIAAAVGIGAALLFKLDASSITQGATELARAQDLQDRVASVDLTLPQKIVEFIPSNVFLDFTGARPTSTLGVVIFAMFVGIAYTTLKGKQAKEAAFFARLIDSFYAIIIRIVRMIIQLTPYGVFAIITNTTATSDLGAIAKLGTFVVASYVALIVMFIIHLAILGIAGMSPKTFLKEAMPALTFAFTSRTSAGALPLNVAAQERMGVPSGIANFSASFGLSIGQNGCAGIYPAMLAIMIAVSTGIDVTSWTFILTVIAVVAISSFGVAGVGGGATFAAIIVLSALNLPVGLAGVLISVEPLIDMGRTALNVSDSMVAGVVTSKVDGSFDPENADNEEHDAVTA